MVEITIRQPGCPPSSASLQEGAYLIGSDSSCQICVDRPEISARHAQLVINAANVLITDLGSSNGTFADGKRITPHRAVAVPFTSQIQIGKLLLTFRKDQPKMPPQNEPSPAASKPDADKAPPREDSRTPVKVLKVTGIPANLRPLIQEIKKHAHQELLVRLNLKKLAISGISADELNTKAKAMVKEILAQLTIQLPPELDMNVLEQELIQEAIGLGPLEYLIARDDISEIMVNGPDQIFVEQRGEIYRTDAQFADSSQVLSAIERIVAPLGRRIDESSPMVDARLADGSRVNAIIPPLALTGPTLTIRKFSRTPLKADDLVRFGSVSPEMVKFLSVCVQARKNIIISGGTGSGKTTLLNVLSSFLPNRERIVTIEDAAELQLNQEHIVRLESRPPNLEGRGAVTIRDLVRNALRMRPDRIVVGECRGGEALDMLQAMNPGHDGSLTTIHANSPRDALARLETLVLMAGFDLPLRAIREQIASAIHIIVQITRERDGSRKIINISEITQMEGDVITMQDLFTFNQTGRSDDNRILGDYLPTGNIPTFMEDIQRAKLDLDISLFAKEK